MSPKFCTSVSTNTMESTTISALSITVLLMNQNKAYKVYFVMNVTSANNNFKALMDNYPQLINAFQLLQELL